MKIIIRKNYSAMSRSAAKLIAKEIKNKPDIVLGLPTGHTPLGMYACLADEKKNGLDFSRVIAFNLDEYAGLKKTDKRSFHHYMNANFYRPAGLPNANRNILNGAAKDKDKECAAYEKKIRAAGGIDLMILGIGHNGHIGFNEPGSGFSSRTRQVDLSDNTRKINARIEKLSLEEIPNTALTMGLATIMEARKIILLVSGKDKAKIIKKALAGKIDIKIPASILQNHPHLTVILDEAAAKDISPSNRLLL